MIYKSARQALSFETRHASKSVILQLVCVPAYSFYWQWKIDQKHSNSSVKLNFLSASPDFYQLIDIQTLNLGLGILD